MQVVRRQSDAETYIDPTTGVVYEQLGDTIFNFGKRGGVVGRTTNAAQPSFERSENIAQYTSDASFLLGPADRADIPIEMPSFANVTLRRKTIDFLGGLPSVATVDTTGGAWSVPSDATYGQLLRLTTGPGRTKLYLPGLKMGVAPQHKILLLFWLKQNGRQFIEYGFHDNLGANHITMQRVDAAGEGAWWGVVRINNAPPVYVPLADPAGGPYRSGMGRKFLAVSVVWDGVEFIGGASAHNEGCVIGKYTGPRPTAALHPYLSIESTDGASKIMDVTHGEVVWPG